MGRAREAVSFILNRDLEERKLSFERKKQAEALMSSAVNSLSRSGSSDSPSLFKKREQVNPEDIIKGKIFFRKIFNSR